MKRPHEVLGVAKEATPEQIKKAYRKLAQKHHPDRNPDDPEAAARFQEVHQAFVAMSAEAERATRTGQRSPFETPEHIFEQFSAHFDQLFRQGKPHLIALNLSLEAILQGGPHTFDLEEQEKCTCSMLARSTCKRCKGTGVVRTHKSKYRVVVPPGAPDGLQLMCQNIHSVKQERVAVVQTQDHPVFKREGADLWRAVTLDYPSLVLGGTLNTEGLRGPLAIPLPAGVQAGQRVRIPGQGLPDLQGGWGSLYLQVNVHIPEALTPRQRDAVIALAQALADS